MSTDALYTAIVFAAAMAFFVLELLPADLVGLLVLLALALGGVLPADDALRGFANPALLTVGAMFVISAGLTRTGALNFVAYYAERLTGGNRRATFATVFVTTAVMSAFINNTPVAIIFLPIVLALAERMEVPPSKLLIPLSFATILGGTCTLIGTSTNLLVAQAAETAGYGTIGMFDFALPGLIYAATGLAFLALLGPRLLPSRASATSMLGSGRPAEFVTEVSFQAGSPLVGRSFQEVVGKATGLSPVMVIRGEETHAAPLIANPHTQFIRAGDAVLLRGRPDAINALVARGGVSLPPELGAAMAAGKGRSVTLVELVLTPTSALVGRTLGGTKFSARHGGASVLAVLRREEHLRERVAEIRLRLGDTLLVVADEDSLGQLRASEDFILLEGVDRQVVRREKAPLAIGILAAVVLLASFEALPISILSLAGAATMILAGCLPLRLAYNSIEIPVLVLIAGMLALAEAFERTGLVQLVSHEVVAGLQPWGPRAVMAGMFLLATFITNFASNNAVAVLLTPISLSVAAELGYGPAPFLYAVLFGASAAFATPIGYQTNMFVYGPGNYRFMDYVRIGVPMTLVLFLVMLFVVPWFFPFVPLAP